MILDNSILEIVRDNLRVFSRFNIGCILFEKLNNEFNEYLKRINVGTSCLINKEFKFKVIRGEEILTSLLQDEKYVRCLFNIEDTESLDEHETVLDIPTRFFLIKDFDWESCSIQINNQEEIEYFDDLDIELTMPKGKEILDSI